MTKSEPMPRIWTFIAGSVMLLWMTFPVSSFAQAVTGGPGQPEFSSFEPSGGNQMVDPLTGDFTLNTPIVNIPGPSGGYSMSLHYHAGITVDQVASWCGLGWNINPGAINRGVIGFPDDWNGEMSHLLGYKDLGTITTNNLLITKSIEGIVSPSLSFNWGSHQSFGWEYHNGMGFRVGSQGGNRYASFMGMNIVGSRGGSSGGGAIPSGVSRLTHQNIFIPLPLGAFSKGKLPSIYYSYNRTSYWVEVDKLYERYGTLYAAASGNTSYWYADIYRNPWQESNGNWTGKMGLTSPAFDQFVVGAEGIGGAFRATYQRDAGFSQIIDFLNSPNNPETFSFDNGGLSREDIQFVFDGQVYSGYQQSPGDWEHQGNYVFNRPNQSSSLTDPTYFNTNTNHPGTPNPIFWFSNQEIYENYFDANGDGMPDNLVSMDEYGFMEYEGFTPERNGDHCDWNGIGGFVITNSQGVTYHFALPVYQFEVVSGRYADATDFFIDIDKGGYATNWLLTGITGPNFVDMGGGVNGDQPNGKIDDSDLGYWVKFSYGKWSDGYLWRTPHTGFIKEDATQQYGTFQLGRKQVYYLNSVETATHIAYFVKDVRKDAQGAELTSINSQLQRDRWHGILKREGEIPSCPQNNVGEYEINALIELELGGNGVQLEPHALLALREILVISKEESFIPIGTSASPSNGPATLSGSRTYQRYVSSDECTTDHIIENDIVPFQYHTFENVIDMSDVTSSLRAQAMNRVTFDHNYELAEYTPNSISTLAEGGVQGRLTLKGIQFFGQDDAKIEPPYEFTYKDQAIYNYNTMDGWGFYAGPGVQKLPTTLGDVIIKPSVDNWSLSEVLTPSGAKMRVNYESDTYAREAVFASGLSGTDKVKVLETGTGQLYLEFPSGMEASSLESIFRVNEVLKPTFTIRRNTTSIDYMAPCEIDAVWETSVSAVNYDGNKVMMKTPSSWTLVSSVPNSSNGLCPGKASFDFVSYDSLEFSWNNQIGYGGGLRVNTIEIEETPGVVYRTVFDYSNPNTGSTSGVTTYSPLSEEVIPYVFEIPGPGVIYEYFSVHNESANAESSGTTRYRFEVYENASQPLDYHEFQLGNQFWVTDNVNQQNGFGGKPNYLWVDLNGEYLNQSPNFDAYVRSSVMHDNLGVIGRPKQIQTYTANGVLTSLADYDYFNWNNLPAGIDEQIDSYYAQYEFILPSDRTSHNISYQRIRYPSITSAEKVSGPHMSTTLSYPNFDPVTRQPLEITSKSTTINQGVAQVVPGSETRTRTITQLRIQYPALGPKMLDLGNQNILVGTGSSESELYSNNTWLTIGATARGLGAGPALKFIDHYTGDHISGALISDMIMPTTVYTWKGSLNDDGSLASFSPFNYNNPVSNGWKKSSMVSRFALNGSSLEVIDFNGRYASTKLGYGPYFRTTASASNASYFEFCYSGMEDYDATKGRFSGNVRFAGGATLQEWTGDLYTGYNQQTGDAGEYNTANTAHTGTYSLRLNGSGQRVFWNSPVDVQTTQYLRQDRTYRVSAWVKSSGIPSGVIVYAAAGGSGNPPFALATADANTFHVGDWYLLTLDVPLDNQSDDTQIFFGVKQTGSGTFYVDDFRVHPVDAPMTSYVYDHKTGRVIAILDQENIASYVRYYDTGRMWATFQESQYGVKKVSEQEYYWARD